MLDTKPFTENTLGEVRRDDFYFLLCHPQDECVSNRQAIMWLNKLCIETGAKIVISSSWRHSKKHSAEKCLRNSGLLPKIEVVGSTPTCRSRERGEEISLFLSTYPNEVENYVILDDDIFDIILEHKEHFVKTNTHVGFTAVEYSKAMDILMS